jgi:hypothetical protein
LDAAPNLYKEEVILFSSMAKRGRARRYYGTAKKAYRRSSSRKGKLTGGIFGNVVDGILVGAVQNIIPQNALGGFAAPATMLGVGWFRGNQTLQVIGGYQLGLKLAGMMTGSTGGTGFIPQE